MNPLRSLDLTLLRALQALLDARNVTHAASTLGVSQPAMSGMLQRLREAFDDPLFVRAQRGVVPTPRALALAVPLRQVLADLDALLQPAQFDPSSAQLTLTVAATDYALRAVAVPFLAALKQQAPQVRVALINLDDSAVQGQLERGEVDLALLTPASAPGELHARTLFREHYRCALRDNHPALHAGPQLSLDAFCALDHALVSLRGAGFAGVTDQALAREGRTRRVSVSVQSFLMLPELLRASDLVAVLPSRLLREAPGLHHCPPPLPIEGFDKIAAWHERTHHDPAQRWLRELLFDSVQGE